MDLPIVVISIIIVLVLVIVLAILSGGLRLLNKVKKSKEDKVGAVLKKSPYRKPPPIKRPNNEILQRDRDKEKEIEEAKYDQVTRYQEDEIEKEVATEQAQIVDVVKPVGFWTRFIMSQKINFMIAHIKGQRNGTGYWQALVNAQAAFQGKNKGKGR
jgi:predicted Holliday junction resolvase-like endonuclease